MVSCVLSDSLDNNAKRSGRGWDYVIHKARYICDLILHRAFCPLLLWTHGTLWKSTVSRRHSCAQQQGDRAGAAFVLLLHFSICFLSKLWPKVVQTKGTEIFLLGAVSLMSPRTALRACSWLPSSPLLLFPSLWPPPDHMNGGLWTLCVINSEWHS